MAKQPKIAIVGAGPAGSSLAIRLARLNFDVTLIDKDTFPRHKLCGEFISPECLDHFEELGIKSDLLALGGDRITQTRFYSAGGRSVGVPTEWFGRERFALSLSRAEMDHALWKAAVGAGVQGIEGFRVMSAESRDGSVVAVDLRATDGSRSRVQADVFIDASGRSAVLSNLIDSDRRTTQRRANLVGFKTHVSGVTFEPGICEIYFFEGGYVGLSHVENGKANFCGLVTSKFARQFIGNTNLLFQHVVLANARASARMSHAVPLHDWLAVKVDRFGIRKPPPAKNVLAIGDAGAFMDPFTGSGILMALESARIAASMFSSKELQPSCYYTEHREFFGGRLKVASILRRAAFSHRMAAAAIRVAGLSDGFREVLARATRMGRSAK